MHQRAVFLDRDGTINHDSGFVHRVADLRLLAGAAAGLSRIQSLGYRLVITTNQSGIARGLFSEDQMHAFNRALVERLAAEGIEIAAIYHCPFHPTEGAGAFRRDSAMRKPHPGMILRAAAELDLHLGSSYTIGDRASDVQAGRAAGCRTILVPSDVTGEVPPSAQPDFTAADLVAAAQFIERDARLAHGATIAATSAMTHFPIQPAAEGRPT